MINIQDIRDTARDMLAKGEVRAVIGYRRGTRGMLAEPAFITSPEQADDLVWDPTCFHNLSLYLVEDRKFLAHLNKSSDAPIAVIAKGCDARSIVVLLQEHYFKREDVYIIGVSCEGTGVVDERKLAPHLNGFQASNAVFDGDDFVFTTAQGEKRLPAREVMADRCLECRNPFPKENNVVFGEHRRALGLLESPFRPLHPLFRLSFSVPDVLLRRVRGGQHYLPGNTGNHGRGKSQPHSLDRSVGDAFRKYHLSHDACHASGRPLYRLRRMRACLSG